VIINHFISYPKSGRSWLRFALSVLGYNQEIAFHHDGFEFNDGKLPAQNYDPGLRRMRYAPPCRLVYLTRDPCDIIVSLYFQVTGRFRDFFNYQGDISAFIRDCYFGAESLHKFQQMWEQLCDEGLALKISYEECHSDFEDILRRVLGHYRLDYEREDIRKAAQISSFENMKQIEQSGAFPEPWLRPRNEFLKVRKGKIGGYREILADEDIAFLESVFGKKPGTSGISPVNRS
jgi:hypothetical protein